jgi:hypothetical protein
MQWNAPISDAQILGVMSDEGRGLLRGCYWGEWTRHGVLDIDQGSKYHSAQELQKLLRVFEAVGLSLSIYRSSESGGWHLYFYFDSYVLSQEVETTIKNYLRASGYEIKSGTLEIFPSGNALRLPLQRGFAWLDSDGTLDVSREELSQEQALALFYSNVLENQKNWSQAKELIESQIRSAGRGAGAGVQAHEEAISNHGFDGLFFKGVDLDKYERGRNYWLSGLSGKSERHDAILSIGHYLWYGDPEAGVQALPGRRNSERRAELILGWLAEKHNGHSEDINQGRLDIQGDIERACSWTSQRAIKSKREPYPLTERLISRLCETRNLTPDDFELANARRELKARQKIHAALKDMLAEGRHPTIRSLAEATGCRRETIKKHSDIWGIYAVRGETRLSTGLGDYIAGGQGVSVSGPVFLSAASSGSSSEVLEEENLKDQSSSVGESSALVLGDPLNFPVAPLFPCLAESLAGAPLRQAQVLRMPTASLTPGPEHAAIQALRHVTAGGTCFSGPLCYSDATTSSIVGRGAAVSRERSQPCLWGQRENKNTVSDATNYKFLTTSRPGYSSEKEDKFSLIRAGENVINFHVIVQGVSLSGAAELQSRHKLKNVHSFYIKLSSQIDVSNSASGLTSRLCTPVTKLTPHDVNAYDRRLLDLSANVAEQIKSRWMMCTQVIYGPYLECGYYVGRGPPGT